MATISATAACAETNVLVTGLPSATFVTISQIEVEAALVYSGFPELGQNLKVIFRIQRYDTETSAWVTYLTYGEYDQLLIGSGTVSYKHIFSGLSSLDDGDYRGYVSAQTALGSATDSDEFDFYVYSAPSISAFNVLRCTAAGVSDEAGTYAKFTATYAVSPIGDNNTKALVVKYRETGRGVMDGGNH